MRSPANSDRRRPVSKNSSRMARSRVEAPSSRRAAPRRSAARPACAAPRGRRSVRSAFASASSSAPPVAERHEAGGVAGRPSRCDRTICGRSRRRDRAPPNWYRIPESRQWSGGLRLNTDVPVRSGRIQPGPAGYRVRIRVQTGAPRTGGIWADPYHKTLLGSRSDHRARTGTTAVSHRPRLLGDSRSRIGPGLQIRLLCGRLGGGQGLACRGREGGPTTRRQRAGIRRELVPCPGAIAAAGRP
jgi:hypothetical protein